MTARSDERAAFLSGILITAIEHGGYGFPGTTEYQPEPNDDPRATYAVIFDAYEVPDDVDWDDNKVWRDNHGQGEPVTIPSWRVDLDTIAKGLGVVRKLYAGKPDTAQWVRDLLTADKENEGSDIDTIGALLILECAIFGEMRYA